MAVFNFYTGTVTSIEDFWSSARQPDGCNKLYAVRDQNRGQVNFVVHPSTYFVNGDIVRVGNNITGFYDPNVATPMIFPPQYRALVIARSSPNQNVTVDWFSNQLVSSDGTLRLNIGRDTRVMLTNGQPFTGRLGNRNLIVVYGPTTRSIPAQTTPQQVIVLC